MISGDAFLEIARSRRSIRRFADRPVPEAMLRKLVEAAVWAPSAGARQDWQFAVGTSPAIKTKMAELVQQRWREILDTADGAATEALRTYSSNFDWFAHAPAIVAISAAKTEAFLMELLGDAADLVAGRQASAAMAAQNLMLAAHAHGLGSCCLTGPLAAHTELEDLLGLGRKRVLVCLIAVGYLAEEPAAPTRKPSDHVMRILA